MSTHGVGVVLIGIDSKSDKPIVIGLPLSAEAPCHHIFVVVVFAGGQVGAVTIAIKTRHSRTHAQLVIDDGRTTQENVLLREAADRAADGRGRLIGQTLGHIFHRTPNGVAAIQGALWATQNFDALDIVHI